MSAGAPGSEAAMPTDPSPSPPTDPSPSPPVDLGTPHVHWGVDGGIATCTIDRPERRNAMTGSMYLAVRTAVGIMNASHDVHALIITGSGDSFCPGGDLSGGDNDSEGTRVAIAAFGNQITPYELIRRSAKPVVAAINGTCQGGGLLTAMVCDVVIASDRATFRVPEVIRGVVDANFAAYLPAHIGVARARDLILTGRRFDAHEAFALGVVSRLVLHDDLLTAARAAAVELVRGAPEAREGFTAFVEHRAPSWIPAGFEPDGRL